jgi:predicted patatin/cPLA2 family phospholipase
MQNTDHLKDGTTSGSIYRTPGNTVNAALVVEGGALRGVFSTGVLDGFLKAGFNPFDLYIGVSSGASNIAAYLAEMPGRNHRIYTDYSLRPEFISYLRFLRGGHLLDLDWMWEITIREIRLDLKKIYTKQKPFLAVLTDVETGDAVYHETSSEDLEHVLKASSAIPLFYRNYLTVGGRRVTDGGVADSIPVGEAIRRGATRVMVIRSRQSSYNKDSSPAEHLMLLAAGNHNRLRQAMSARALRYNEAAEIIRRPPAGVSITEVCPPEGFRVSRLSRNRAILQEGYEQGHAMAHEAIRRWETY